MEYPRPDPGPTVRPSVPTGTCGRIHLPHCLLAPTPMRATPPSCQPSCSKPHRQGQHANPPSLPFPPRMPSTPTTRTPPHDHILAYPRPKVAHVRLQRLLLRQVQAEGPAQQHGRSPPHALGGHQLALQRRAAPCRAWVRARDCVCVGVRARVEGWRASGDLVVGGVIGGAGCCKLCTHAQVVRVECPSGRSGHWPGQHQYSGLA